MSGLTFNSPKVQGPASAPNRVASAIRDQIIDGTLVPGVRLPEERMRSELGVSRSSLREGFQILIQERLLVHVLSRGFFVRELSRADIADVFTARRTIECAALLEATALQPQHLQAMARAVTEGREGVEQRDWQKVAAANIRFHEAVVAFADSERLNIMMRQVLTEYRLSYQYMSSPYAYHAPYLERNVRIADQIRSGDLAGAADALRIYLHESEELLLADFSEI
ncbi:transcriptional regulator, GntR family [Arthrobacter sp. yr096]|uniref:GntR family transcriptional regulator n=1 Tax=Arthrobacter sp. yr096 TaxID=1761750 RepID=UPI0008CB029C|nr:GntR family transcriptional regulator [Arthrobacter sp. yr096]SEJ77848.1 transcriptional regulator, GntR family [Arthrobacter sp. yr096]